MNTKITVLFKIPCVSEYSLSNSTFGSLKTLIILQVVQTARHPFEHFFAISFCDTIVSQMKYFNFNRYKIQPSFVLVTLSPLTSPDSHPRNVYVVIFYNGYEELP